MIQIDMQMPYNCSECRFKTEYEFCKAKPDNFCGNTNDKVRPEWCPLKEQEAVKPFIQISEHTGRKWLTCGACEYPIESEKESWEEINFCPKCGRPIIWEGR